MTGPRVGVQDDFAKWKAEQDFAKWKAAKEMERSAAGRDVTRRAMPGTAPRRATAPRDPRSGKESVLALAANFIDALAFGSLDEMAALTGGIGGAVSGEGFREGAQSGYQGMKLLREGGQEHDPGLTRLARGGGMLAGIIPSLAAGGVPTAIGARLGLRAAPEAAAASIPKAMLTAGGIGAGMGALSDGGVGERTRNAALMGVGTALIPPVVAGGLWAAGKVPGAARGLKRVFGNAVGRAGEAAEVVWQRMKIDRTGGLIAPHIGHPSVPSLAIDEAGPAVQGLAKGILHEPGEGRAILGRALENRSTAMRPAITAELERRTGMPAANARRVLVEIADEQKALTSAQDAVKAHQKALKQAAKRPVNQPTSAHAARAFEAEAGVAPNGITKFNEVMDETTTQMREVYDQAREATRGFAVESPTFAEVIETPIGKQAWEFAQISKANTGSALPTIERALPMGGMSAEQLAVQNARNVSRGVPPIVAPTESIPVPDPESIHLMKRYFANVARLGQQDGAQGLQAARAQGALKQWDNIRNEILDPAWRQADDVATQLFNTRRAAKLALDAAKAVPNPGSRRAATMSIRAVQDRVAAMSPEERAVFDPIFKWSIGSRIEGNSAAATHLALTNPKSGLFQLVEMATGNTGASSRIAAATARAPKPNIPILAVPQASRGLQAAQRGLSVLSTPAEAAAGNAGKTLPLLARDAAALPSAERGIMREAASANLRQAWEGVPSAQQSPGRFFASSPERVEQTGYAFRSPAEAGLFQKAVGAWDDVQSLKSRLMGGSDTAANLAEPGARASELERAVADYSTMGTGYATRRVMGRLGTRASERARQEVDEEVAKILAKSGGKLSDAEAAATARNILARVRSRLGIGAGAIAADQVMHGLLSPPK